MCGIAGLYNFSESVRAPELARSLVRQMITSIAHRGPDAEGVWADHEGRCILGHRRLSIIDTSDAGRQPMGLHDGKWIITFNGEIYNFQELRQELQGLGITFHGRTDTEVLLAGITKWGVEVLPRLDGMFAFAAFNTESGELLLARDPFGEKPLYYMDLPGGGLAFASELHCLELLPGFNSEVSADSMAEVLMFQYVGAPRTIYRSVKKLQPAYWLKLSVGSPPQSRRYFEFAPGRAGFDRRPITDLADELEHLLATSLRRRLISDVPLGAFLSGGVDSSTVCALICKRLGMPLKTFSMGFEGAEESEHEIARQFAEHLGTEHHYQVLRPDTAHFLEDIGSVLDEPNADSSCMPTFLLSEFARSQVTVALSGDGGDEMFGGYGRYFDTLLEQRPYGLGAISSWTAGDAYYSGRILVFEPSSIEELFGQVPDGLAQHLRGLKEEINKSREELLCVLRKTDVENYMPGAVLSKVDRMSMRHSLEVRTPFLNVALARFAERLAPDVLVRGRHGKLVLRELAYRYLPKHLVDMPKQGFGIPISGWGKKALLSLAERKLMEDGSSLLAILGHNRVHRFLLHQRSGSGFSAYQLWGVMMLESWLRVHSVRLSELPKEDSEHDRIKSRSSCSIVSAAWIAPKLLAVLPRDMNLSIARPCSSSQERDHRDRLATAIVQLFCSLDSEYLEHVISGESAQLDAEELPAEVDLENALRSAGFPLRGTTLVVIDPVEANSLSPKTLNELQRAGAKSLVYMHPHRTGGHFVKISFNRKGLLRRYIAIGKLKHRAIASWSLAEAGHVKGFCHIIGPFVNLPNVTNQELSHDVLVFEGMKQLPPIPSTHERIATDGQGRYSVWNQHVFFSPTGKTKLPVKFNRYWAVHNNARNSALIPMTVKVTGTGDLSASHFVSQVETYFASVSSRDSEFRRTEENARHIVLLTHGLSPGGAERQWCYLAIGLKRLGYNITFVTCDWLEGELAHYKQLLTSHGIAPYELGRISIASLIRTLANYPNARTLLAPEATPFWIRLIQLVTLLDHVRPIGLLAQLDPINILAGIAGTMTRTPKIIMSFRNVNPSHFSYLRNDWFLPAYRALIKNPAVILSGNSRSGNKDYAQWIGVSPKKVSYVGNAIDSGMTGYLADQAPFQIGAQDGAKSLSILGVFRLSEEKRPIVFLDVCQKAKSAVPDVKVFIVGTGPMEASLTAEIQKREMSHYVKLLGRRNNVCELMRLSSLLLLTSSFEGTPNVVMEAQAVGLPVVATRVGGVPDLVVDGETGYLVEPDDINGLVNASVKILTNPQLRIRMGESARSRIANSFTVESMVQQYLQLVHGPMTDA